MPDFVSMAPPDWSIGWPFGSSEQKPYDGNNRSPEQDIIYQLGKVYNPDGTLSNSGSSEESSKELSIDNWKQMIDLAFKQTQELDQAEREFNSAEAQKNRDWQRYMSDTAYTRVVEDLQRAGLNKWLALNGGSIGAASTPSGAQASYSSSSEIVTKIVKAFLSYIATLGSSGMKSIMGLFDFF